jgi:hypothetical protein
MDFGCTGKNPGRKIMKNPLNVSHGPGKKFLIKICAWYVSWEND